MTAAESTCLIAFGANQGDRERMLVRAVQQLGEQGFRECLASRLYRTRPIGGPADQGEYVNAVIRARCSGMAAEIVQRLLAVEAACGRQRSERWAPRTIDLDLLLLGDQTIDQPAVQIPHPRMTCRRFVLEPACEIAAELKHPWSGATLGELFEAVSSATPFTAAWLWPAKLRDQAEFRLASLQQGLGQRGVRAQFHGLDRHDLNPFSVANWQRPGLAGDWHILLVPDPLQLKRLEQPPGLVILWGRPRKGEMTTEFELAYRAALQHVGAVALLDSEPNEAVRELAAAMQAVEEFWHRAEASAD
jgi:2-amino-4-hydroxy-6-hydroxymethyldihydropteridine diphosphokinase